MPWSHIPWKATFIAMVLATGLFAIACGGGEENDPLKLVPEGANLIAEIELADILETVDLDSLLDALPDEEDVPQTIDEALDLIVSQFGIDLREISRAIIFGDTKLEDGYVGIIARGTFDEERLVASILTNFFRTQVPLSVVISMARNKQIREIVVDGNNLTVFPRGGDRECPDSIMSRLGSETDTIKLLVDSGVEVGPPGGVVVTFQEGGAAPVPSEIYKGRELYMPQDDPDSITFTLLNEETLVIGTSDAVRDVIDVQEGDRKRAEGDVNAAFDDLPRGLIRLSLAVPPEALQDAGGGIEEFLGQQEIFGELPISLESFDKLEIFGFALGQDGDALNFHVRLNFADQESASTVGDLLDGLLKVAGSLLPDKQVAGILDRVQVDHSENTVTLRLEIVTEELKDLLEGLLTVTSEESFRQEISPAQAAERDVLQTAIDVLMADNSLSQVTAPPTAVNEFSGLDLDPGDGEAFLTSYIRETTTTYYYCWIENGRVISQTESPSGCPQRAVRSIIVSPTHTPGFGTFRSLPGEEVAIMPTRNHVPDGASVAYSTTPPTSGDHWERWADCGFHENGLPDELIVHNLEHGNIVVSYNVSAEQAITALRRALASIDLAEEWGVTRFYDKIPKGMVSVAAWGRRARMPGFDLDTLAGFFAAYAGVAGPERVAC